MLVKIIIRFVTATTLSLFFFVSNIHAYEFKDQPFIGLEAQFIWYSFYGVTGAVVYAGYRWEQLGLELGYIKPANENNIYENGNSLLIYNSQIMYLDGLLFKPICKNLDLKGRLGLGYFTTRNTWNYNFNNYGTEQSLGVRLGVGFQYNLSKHVSGGLGYTFQSNHNISVGCANTIGLSLTYYG